MPARRETGVGVVSGARRELVGEAKAAMPRERIGVFHRGIRKRQGSGAEVEGRNGCVLADSVAGESHWEPREATRCAPENSNVSI